MYLYLQVLRRVGRVGGEQPEHVDQTAARPRAHPDILVLQQAGADQFGRDRLERLAVRLLLVDGAQLAQQCLETRQQLAHAELLARPPDQRLLELQRPGASLCFFLCLFLLLRGFGRLLYHLDRGGSAAPAAWSHVACGRVQSAQPVGAYIV